jgi:hypothetical protein
MFSNSYLFVEAILDEKRAKAAAERLASKTSTIELKARLAAAAKSTWSLLSGPADRPNTPTLVNYPFRG